ncbi:MAG: NAD(P)H-dependent oxidoreductase subunit E [Bacteroidetes bacterium]|nr:NAD(P)H-dependent oxidoreductase subunit E [Bacteroidota bacterium]
MEETLDKILRKYSPGKKDALIPLLQEIQRETGHLSDGSIAEVSRHMNIPLNKIYGVATFYDQFRFGTKGRYHIQLCRGTTCHVYRSSVLLKDAERILQVKAGQTTRDGKFSLEIVNCLGACANAPVMMVNGKAYGDMTREKMGKVLMKVIEIAK